MKIEKAREIADYLSKKKTRYAKRLNRFLLDYYYAKDDTAKKEAYRKLRDYLYLLFCSLLTKRSAETLSNLGVDISERCYLLERHVGDGWYIGTQAATRLIVDDKGHKVEQGRIPRKYHKGFYLENRPEITSHDRLCNQVATDFYYDYTDKLNEISDVMDAKMDHLTYGLEFKRDDVDMKLVEDLIECLEWDRVPKEQQAAKIIPFPVPRKKHQFL